MPIVGHQITKIVGKRGETEHGIEIKSNVELRDVKKKELNVAGDKKSSLTFEFEFIVQYGEKAGGINISGELFYTGDKKELDSLEKQWAKDKKIDKTMIISILNRAMELGYLEAIHLSERLRLPPPLKLPRFIAEENQNKK